MTLHISNLSKRYANNWVLRDITIDVEKGKILGILGGSQTGKSTFLRILAGKEKPSTELGPFSEFKEIQSIGLDGKQGRLWEFVRKSNHGRVTPHAFRTVLNSATDVLLIDDPLSQMDLQTREELLNELKDKVNEHQLTVIYATADFETAALISDEIAVLDSTYIQQTGTAEELYESPVSTTVARLTGRCNVISARRLTSTRFEVPEFQTIDGGHRLLAEKADIGKLGAINRNVSLAIRPENISMSFGASFPEDNLIKAVITGVKYLGPITLVELDASGLTLTAQVLRLVGLGIGQECMLGLPPERIKVLKD